MLLRASTLVAEGLRRRLWQSQQQREQAEGAWPNVGQQGTWRMQHAMLRRPAPPPSSHHCLIWRWQWQLEAPTRRPQRLVAATWDLRRLLSSQQLRPILLPQSACQLQGLRVGRATRARLV